MTLPHKLDWVRRPTPVCGAGGQSCVLKNRVDEAGIGTGIDYPIALHFTKVYEGLDLRIGDFPVAEGAAVQVVSITRFTDLTSRQQDRVVDESLTSLAVTSGSVLR